MNNFENLFIDCKQYVKLQIKVEVRGWVFSLQFKVCLLFNVCKVFKKFEGFERFLLNFHLSKMLQKHKRVCWRFQRFQNFRSFWGLESFWKFVVVFQVYMFVQLWKFLKVCGEVICVLSFSWVLKDFQISQSSESFWIWFKFLEFLENVQVLWILFKKKKLQNFGSMFGVKKRLKRLHKKLNLNLLTF